MGTLIGSMTTLFDTHCHFDYLVRNARDEADAPDVQSLLAHMKAAGVRWLVNPGVEPATYNDVLACTELDPGIYAALAVHPTDVGQLAETPDWAAVLAEHLKHPKVVAVGETGLDYYREESIALTAQQKAVFRTHLELAASHNLPVIIHDREAHEDIRQMVIDTYGQNRRERAGVMHCFTGDAAFAHQMIALGFYISFAGNLTFKNAIALQEAARDVPLERLLIETDSPFLSPMPHRGKPNEPARVLHVAEKLAELKGLPLETIAEATTANALSLFGIEAPTIQAGAA